MREVQQLHIVKHIIFIFIHHNGSTQSNNNNNAIRNSNSTINNINLIIEIYYPYVGNHSAYRLSHRSITLTYYTVFYKNS